MVYTKTSIANIPITITGIIVIIGGISLGLFNFNAPNVFMIVVYAILGITGFVMMILGMAYGIDDDEAMMILSSSMMIIATVGICLSGAFVWWVHLILVFAAFMQAGAMGSKVGDEFNL